MTIALLIAASLIFYAAYSLGATIAARRAFSQGYQQCALDLADDAATVAELEQTYLLPSRERR